MARRGRKDKKTENKVYDLCNRISLRILQRLDKIAHSEKKLDVDECTAILKQTLSKILPNKEQLSGDPDNPLSITIYKPEKDAEPTRVAAS